MWLRLATDVNMFNPNGPPVPGWIVKKVITDRCLSVDKVRKALGV